MNNLTEQFMNETRKDITDIKVSVGKTETNVENILTAMDYYNERMCDLEKGKVDKENFYFWRKILVSGILVTATISLAALVLDKYLN